MSFARIFVVVAFLFFANVALAAHPSPSPDLACRQVGHHWQIFDRHTGRDVGHFGGHGGFPNQGACQWSINEAVKAKQNVVCAWNDVGYAPFYLPTNRVVGESDIAWKFLRDCIDLVTKNANGMICNYTGNRWMAYDIRTSERRCEDRVGYHDQAACVHAIHSTPQPPSPHPHPEPGPAPSTRLSCQWNGYSWQPHNELVGFIGLQRYGFAYQQDCRQTVRMSRRNAVCNWDGIGFKPYDVTTNATLSPHSYGTLESCYAVVK